METGFLSSVMSGLSSAANSVGDLFKDGSWLNTAFSNSKDSFLVGENGILTGKNLATTLDGGGKLFNAYSTYKAGKAKDAFDNKVFGLQEQQYNDYQDRLAQEDEAAAKINQSFADVWGN